jgi:hypothetical protein
VTVIASGRPVSPSQQTMHTSATPRDFSSLRTVSQNLADSPVAGPTHKPSICLAPSQSMPDRQVDRSVGDHPIPDLYHVRSGRSAVLVLRLAADMDRGRNELNSLKDARRTSGGERFDSMRVVDDASRWRNLGDGRLHHSYALRLLAEVAG